MFGLLRMRWLFSLLPRTINYFFSEQVPFFYKALLLIPVLWEFTPVARITNLLPPLVGILDEFTVILLTMALFTYLVERRQRRKTQNQTSAPLEIIEGEYYVADHIKEKVG